MNYEVMVVGAGVAGATAAATLGALGHRTVLIERDRLGKIRQLRPEWVTRQALPILDELRVDPAGCLGGPVGGAVFHSADFTRSVVSAAKEVPAFRVDYTQLVRRVNQAAANLGVDRREGSAPLRLQAAEDHVTAALERGETIVARFLVMADGAGSEAAAAPAERRHGIVQARLAVPVARQDDRMHWVLGPSGGAELMAWWFDASALVLEFHAAGRPSELAQRLRAAAASASRKGALPAELVIPESELRWRPAPARPALEFDSHVGKHCLRIGDAGGFLSAVSHEGIYPAMWSARLASEVLSQALGSRHPQDALHQFDAQWRMTMAEYLRLPNADTQFLLPLIFTNQQMADRMAAACWRGENI